MAPRLLLISACLLGAESRYKGGPHPHWEAFFRYMMPAAKAAGFVFLPVCPEQLGGLATPRPPSELQGPAVDVLAGRARILTNQGMDVTHSYLLGARTVAHFASLLGAEGAILADRSPACGVHRVCAGSFDGRLVAGAGVATTALLELGVRCLSSDELLPTAGVAAESTGVHMQKMESLLMKV